MARGLFMKASLGGSAGSFLLPTQPERGPLSLNWQSRVDRGVQQPLATLWHV